MCQALRAEMYLQTVFPDIWPAFEAAKAQRMNSLAGKRSSEGIPSRLQKLRKRVRAKEYPEIVEAERLFWRVSFNKLRVLVEKRLFIGLGGSEDGDLKNSSVRVWDFVGKDLKEGDFGGFFGMMLSVGDGLLWV
jgi:hypothetical protein